MKKLASTPFSIILILLAACNASAEVVTPEPNTDVQATIYAVIDAAIESEAELRMSPYTEEREMVQAAIDMLIADRALTHTTTIASVANTSDFSAVDFDSGTAGNQTLYPHYLRQNPTKCEYAWDVTGRVTMQTGCK